MGILTAALLVEMKIDVTLIDINQARLDAAKAFIPVCQPAINYLFYDVT